MWGGPEGIVRRRRPPRPYIQTGYKRTHGIFRLCKIHRKHKGAITTDQQVDNALMIRPRSPTEDTFKDFVTLSPFFDDKKKHKLLTNGRAKYKMEIIMATIFYNLHTCLYSNQGAGCFYVPPPSPEEYMHNVNLVPCGIADQAKR